MSVYANGREISGKATPNKTIASFPDVCLSPPSPPAGPVPLPYPVTSMASDTGDGTGSVHIKGKEIGKKNGSNYSKCDGNQPATNSFGAGVVSHKLTGKTKFQAYSFDVMLEKSGAERFMDLTTSNHMNSQNTSVMTSTAGAAPPQPPTDADCATMRAEIEGDRNAVQAEIDAGTTGFQSRSLGQSAQSGTLASASTHPGGAMSYGCSNQILADRAQRISGRNYPTPTQPGYQAYAPTASSACNGQPPIQHPTGRHSRHAEMNILNKLDWAVSPPSSITFCIDYPATGGQYAEDMPCPTCQQTINDVCACVDQIYVCDPETNEPVPQCPT